MLQLISHKHNPFLSSHSLNMRSVSRYCCCGGGQWYDKGTKLWRNGFDFKQKTERPDVVNNITCWVGECGTTVKRECWLCDRHKQRNKRVLASAELLRLSFHTTCSWRRAMRGMGRIPYYLPLNLRGKLLLPSQVFCHSSHSPSSHKQARSSPWRLFTSSRPAGV